MGLDMYLTKKTYIGAQYEHRKVNAAISISINGKDVKINPKRISQIEESVGYWRKANQIHKWFVDKCQEGNDDCREAYVSKEQLLELLQDCKEVKNNSKLAAEKLPTQGGFFFGGTDYDDEYMQEIEDTIAIIEGISSEEGGVDKEFWDGEYYYSSSW